MPSSQRSALNHPQTKPKSMQFNLTIIITISVLFLLALGAILFSLYIWHKSHHYTRERFAFVGLAALTSLFFIATIAIFIGAAPWQVLFTFFAQGRGFEYTLKEITPFEYGIFISLFVFFTLFIIYIYNHWPGAISVEQSAQHQEPNDIDGVAEKLRDFYDQLIEKPFLFAFVAVICVMVIYTLMNAWQEATNVPPQITTKDEEKKTPSTHSDKTEDNLSIVKRKDNGNVKIPLLKKENPLSSTKENPLWLSNVKTEDGKNFIVFEAPDPVYKTWMMNKGEEPLTISTSSFPDKFFYSNLLDEGFIKLKPRKEEKKLIVFFKTAVNLDASEYSFTIKDDSERSTPMVIKLEGDWGRFYLAMAKQFKQQVSEQYDSVLEIHNAVVKIVEKIYPNLDPYIQQIVAGQVLSSQRYFKAATIAYQKAEKLNHRISNNPSFKLMVASARNIAPEPTLTGEVFRDRLKYGSLGPEMVKIPAGTFQMGDIQGGGYDREQPVHRVSVNEFAMGRYEVTFAEYDQFAQATGREEPNDEGWERGDRPVINVSWDDATAYTEWLSEETGQRYRLPTEAEWEYAARAGSNTKYWWGNEIGSNRANCDNDSCGDNFKYTAPVGSFAANAFGLYDTVGNVWEWTCSEYEHRYEGKEQYCLSKNRANEKGIFVLRGGSWNSNAGWARSAIRVGDSRADRSSNFGFRPVRLL
jgi:formylglycine-generating enzyme required for sulfatase activity